MLTIEQNLKRRVYTIDNFLTNDECKTIINDFNKNISLYNNETNKEDNKIIFNRFYLNEQRANEYFEQLRERIKKLYFIDKNNRAFKIIAFDERISITKIDCEHITKKHFDEIFKNEKYKMLIYLNDAMCGTNFYFEKEKIEINSKPGRCVMFDISIEHETQIVPRNEIKYVIGFRPIIEYINE